MQDTDCEVAIMVSDLTVKNLTEIPRKQQTLNSTTTARAGEKAVRKSLHVRESECKVAVVWGSDWDA